MATVQITDDSIWFKHIEGDRRLRERLERLHDEEIIELEVDGVVGRWSRMKTGKDGRRTTGLRPLDAMREVWKLRQADRGSIVDIREVRSADSYLRALRPLMSEWDSPEDEAAYRDL